MDVRVLFWGMNDIYTRMVLDTLMQADVSIAGVMVDGSATTASDRSQALARLSPPASDPDILELSLAGGAYVTQNTVNMAWQQGLPVYAVHELAADETASLLRSLDVDIACVACFPKRFPQSVLAIPRLGFLNVHPSLLPDYRGPAPLFWQLRDGVEPLGVTVHRMDERLDTGDIIAQGNVRLPDGIDGPGADRLLAERGGQLLADLLGSVDGREIRGQPQPFGGSYQPRPSEEDFTLDTSWAARRAFNFMRGAAEWGMPFRIKVDEGTTLFARTALSFSARERLAVSHQQRDNRVCIQFSPGVLIVSVVG